MSDMPAELYIIDNTHGNSTVMSGGERIAIELSRQWASEGKARVTVIGSNLTESLWSKYLSGDDEIHFKQIITLLEEENLFFSYLKRTLKGILFACRHRIEHDKVSIIYSASDFWPDSIPALVIALRNRNHFIWIAGFYLFAPNPLHGIPEDVRRPSPTARSLLYWLSQMPVFLLVRRFADVVFVTSKPDVKSFITQRRPLENVIVVRGGVDIEPSSAFLSANKTPARDYDAVFVGRFHPQKGVVELVDIWRMVCEKLPGARLAIIGAGPLEEELRRRIRENNLQDRISLLGFLDGEPKYDVFKRSRIILHPATYDSGGMAAAEGMAWGLPGVSYDLESLKTYYPRGMVKVPPGRPDLFARHIVTLLTDEEALTRLSREARELVVSEWSWPGRAISIWKALEDAGLTAVRTRSGRRK